MLHLRQMRRAIRRVHQRGWRSRQTPGDLMHLAASELRAHGHPTDTVFGSAISWYRSRPAAEVERQQAAFALTLYDAGRFAEAQALYERLSASNGDSIAMLGRLGTLAARRGDRTKANQYSEALLPTTRQHLRGSNTLWRARIAAQLGDRPTAERLLREAFASGVHYGLWLHTDSDLAQLKDADVAAKR